MNYFKRNFLFASAVLFTAFASAQENGETFTTFKEGGHYFITASINGKPETPDISDYPPSKKNLSLNGVKFRITNEGDGKVRIGKHTIFEGPVFILADYENPYHVTVPIHLLHNEADGGSRIVKVDLADDRLQMMSRASLKEAGLKDLSSYRITYKTYMHMPAVKTLLKIEEGGKERTLKGKYYIDLGNAEVLFLVEKNKNTAKFLESRPIHMGR